ncbi:YciI family protein [Bacillus tuaregi]|uniref:YciI family protein n=1 Tax=Bacillus tuaregi TaxID=1816695 RepID=UPI0008F8355F|nr:YciI family protein [Bacillus tuaregi]
MLLYLVKYTLKGNDKGAHLKATHLDYLKGLYDEGTLLTAGLFKGKVGGYLLFRTESYEETQRLVENDPYIVNGVRDFEIESWDVPPFPLKAME